MSPNRDFEKSAVGPEATRRHRPSRCCLTPPGSADDRPLPRPPRQHRGADRAGGLVLWRNHALAVATQSEAVDAGWPPWSLWPTRNGRERRLLRSHRTLPNFDKNTDPVSCDPRHLKSVVEEGREKPPNQVQSEGRDSIVGNDEICEPIRTYEIGDRAVEVLFGDLTGPSAWESRIERDLGPQDLVY